TGAFGPGHSVTGAFGPGHGVTGPHRRTPTMPTNPTTDPRAWRADTIDDPAAWRLALSEQSVAALERPVREWRGGGRDRTARRRAGAADARAALAALEDGRGFVTLTAGPPGRFAPADLTTVYWLVGQLLGLPVEQNVQGTVLYDVRDTGQDVRYGARFSVTN